MTKVYLSKDRAIVIRDASESGAPTDPWDALQSHAGRDLVDPDAYRELRELDRKQPAA